MTDESVGPAHAALDDEQVAEYLRRNPDFFVRHERLLHELRLPHDSGTAISLVERQVHLFREQRDTLRRELHDLIAIARHNDRLFEKSKRLLMHLLEAQNLSDIAMVIDDSIRNDFGLDAAALMLIGDWGGDFAGEGVLSTMPRDQAEQTLGAAIDSRRAVCGQFREPQLRCLFKDQAESVASAAIIPLRNGELLGVFAVGSREEQYFDSSMGSLFLSYISDSLSRMLPPLLHRQLDPVVLPDLAETR